AWWYDDPSGTSGARTLSRTAGAVRTRHDSECSRGPHQRYLRAQPRATAGRIAGCDGRSDGSHPSRLAAARRHRRAREGDARATVGQVSPMIPTMASFHLAGAHAIDIDSLASHKLACIHV